MALFLSVQMRWLSRPVRVAPYWIGDSRAECGRGTNTTLVDWPRRPADNISFDWLTIQLPCRHAKRSAPRRSP